MICVESCRTRVDSCQARVDLCWLVLTCVDSCWYSRIRIELKVSLLSKFLASQPGKQTITIHTLPDVSRGKGSQTRKFGHLIEHNMRNIFLGESFKYFLFLKNQSRGNLWIKSQIYLVFIVIQTEDYQNILKLRCLPLAFTSYKAFL